LGDKFDPRAFDLRLLKEGGGMITPLGLWQVDPDTPWLTRTDVVFRYLKQLLAHDPRLTVLSVTTIATKLGMTPREISNVLHLLRATHGWAVAGMSSSPESSNSHPPLVSDFSVNHEQTFKFYETFRTFAEAISATLLAANPPREL